MYLAMSRQADREGYPEIAESFKRYARTRLVTEQDSRECTTATSRSNIDTTEKSGASISVMQPLFSIHHLH